MTHVCHAEGCNRPVPPKLLFCLPHWKLVDPTIRRLVWGFYKRGQEDRKDPSPGYMIVQAIAVGWVAVQTDVWTKAQCDEHIIKRVRRFAPRLGREELALFWKLEPKVAQMVELVHTAGG